MINFTGNELREEFEEVFGFPIEKLNVRMLWWLVKFAKHIRGRCRNNAALNNYLSFNFKHARFVELIMVGVITVLGLLLETKVLRPTRKMSN